MVKIFLIFISSLPLFSQNFFFIAVSGAEVSHIPLPAHEQTLPYQHHAPEWYIYYTDETTMTRHNHPGPQFTFPFTLVTFYGLGQMWNAIHLS